ncbi:MAG: biopolymer transporter ExbD [Sphingomonas sp.]
MTRAAAARTPPLFSNINVTPFIDVLLVLIIMLILTIPVGTHKLPIDIPQPGKTVAPAEPHVLAIDARGALYWDGRAVGDAQLPALLAATVAADVPLAMNTDPRRASTASIMCSRRCAARA